jgi:transposase
MDGATKPLSRLPPYSPNSNPIEGAWKVTKKLTTHNTFFRTTAERDTALTRTFEGFNQNRGSLGGYTARFP